MSNKTGKLNSIGNVNIRVKILEAVVMGGITHNGTPYDVIKKCRSIEEYVFEDLVDLEDLVGVVNALYPDSNLSYSQIIEAYKRLTK